MRIYQFVDPNAGDVTTETKWIAAKNLMSAEDYTIPLGWKFDCEIFEDGRYADLSTADLLRIGCDAVEQNKGFVT